MGGTFARLLNAEIEWERVAPFEDPTPPVTIDLNCKALMKCGNAAGPSGIIAKMLKAAGGVHRVVDRAN